MMLAEEGVRPADDDASTVARIAEDMVRRADAARDGREFRQAAFLYAEAARLLPDRADLHVQCGHMSKEAGELDAAERHYRTALALTRDDADLALQLGHLLKSAGRLREAHAEYSRALSLQPRWAEPKRELAALARTGWRGSDANGADAMPAPFDGADAGDLAVVGPELLAFEDRALGISRELAPRPLVQALHRHAEELAVRRLGLPQRTRWGVLPTLRGVQAFRGFCISARPILTIELILNGSMVYRGGVRGGYELDNEAADRRLRKYVFNAWLDLTDFVEGRYELRYRAIDVDNRSLERVEQVVIAPQLVLPMLPDCDTAVPPGDPEDPRPLDEQINARPSMVRPARRALLNEPIRTVLVLRPDVLGDLVVSVPALRRLRELLPGARLIGLLSPANVELAATLGVFDEMVTTELTYNPWERRRTVSIEEQRRLAAKLAPYKFDMAIDLSTSGDSRLLLPLSRAPVLVGFPCGELPNMTVEVAGGTRDPWNGHHNVPHTNMALGLVEWLGAQMRSEPNLVVRSDLGPERLATLGLAPDARYVVLHSGGRWQFSRWPHYSALAQMILDGTDLQVVLLTADATAAERLPEALAGAERFRVLSRRLAFDELDALVSYCTVFVGDDSGVKHLAAMRGAKVIGIQNARNNWSEWGHENNGYLMTRKVPCAGCSIQNYHDSLECGRDFICITGIKPEEVFDALQRLNPP